MKKILSAALAAASLAAGAWLPAQASGRDDYRFPEFVEKCDTDKDGMVSKAEVMKMVEKSFEKQDTKKRGKLDRRQVEFFLEDLVKNGA